jgi:Tol biopolymer transport system component
MTNPRPNPYPGPRPFKRGETLFGRQRETAELLDLLIAERIVLLCSPSGAGKTSLVQAALIPELVREGFRILPVMRPGLATEAQPNALRYNRYVLSLLQGLEKDLLEDQQTPLAELAGQTLAGYLQEHWPLPKDADWHGDVLIFDQFEELLTADPTDREAKLACFEQIGQVLRDQDRWALFSMREEYVAALDPYLQPLPVRFDKGRRYLLDLLGPDAARAAIQLPPAEQAPRVLFTDTAADRLISDLRRAQVQQPDGTMTSALGPNIEPVQLQVVCRRLWDGLDPDDAKIDLADLAVVGDVDTALRGYYDDTVRTAAEKTGVRERAVREWVNGQLITEQGIRAQVLKAAERSQGLANAAIELLEAAHVLRAEQRRGATWFELAHDRLIAPVRASNTAWFEAHLSTLQRQAQLWEGQKQPDGLLLSGKALTEADSWARDHEAELETHERLFLAACHKARRQRLLILLLAAMAAVVAVAAIIAAGFALTAEDNAVAQANRALTAEKDAVEAANRALTAEAMAATQKATAEAASTLAVNERNNALAWARSVDNLQATLNAKMIVASQPSAPTDTLTPAATPSLSPQVVVTPGAIPTPTLPVEATSTPSPSATLAPVVLTPAFGPTPTVNRAATVQALQIQAAQMTIAATSPFRIAGATSLQTLTDQMIARYGAEKGNSSNIFTDYVGSQAGLEAFCAPNSTVDIVLVTGTYTDVVRTAGYEDRCLKSGRTLVDCQVARRPIDAARGRSNREPLSVYTDVTTLASRPRVAEFLQFYLAHADEAVAGLASSGDYEAVAPPAASCTAFAAARPSPTATAKATAVPTPGIALPVKDRIVFASNRTSDNDLFIMNVDGTGLRRVTSDIAYLPSYSQEADMLAYTTQRPLPGNSRRVNVNIVRPDGSGGSNLGGFENDDWDPAFSPDGRRVAFVTSRDGNREIYVLDLDSRQVTRLTNDQAGDYSPAWSPDGKQIVFASERDMPEGCNCPEIYVMNAAGGSDLKRLTTNTVFDAHPKVSLDGKSIAFASDRGGSRSIYVMDVNGKNVRRLTTSPWMDQYPAWSGDGKWLVFDRRTGENVAQLFVVDVRGNQLRQITSDASSNWGAVWLPR